MKAAECLREHEVMEIVSCGRWPDRCPDELRQHIAACNICTDVLEVALAFHADGGAHAAGVQIPSAGLVWWRAELRSRQEAMRKASRPMTLVQAFGAAAGVGVAIALLTLAWSWLKAVVPLPDFSTLSLSQAGILIAFAVVLIVVIAPLAYLVLSDE
jgi:hypothetical protein